MQHSLSLSSLQNTQRDGEVAYISYHHHVGLCINSPALLVQITIPHCLCCSLQIHSIKYHISWRKIAKLSSYQCLLHKPLYRNSHVLFTSLFNDTYLLGDFLCQIKLVWHFRITQHVLKKGIDYIDRKIAIPNLASGERME